MGSIKIVVYLGIKKIRLQLFADNFHISFCSQIFLAESFKQISENI